MYNVASMLITAVKYDGGYKMTRGRKPDHN